MTLSFRNVEADPADPVESWPYEALVAAIERGGVRDWARVTRAVRAAPWGEVARAVEDYLGYADPSGATALLRRAVGLARADAAAADRAEVARTVRRLVAESGLSRAEFASRSGTSASRLSTYATGKVVPSAALMLRLERVAGKAADRLSGQPDAPRGPGSG